MSQTPTGAPSLFDLTDPNEGQSEEERWLAEVWDEEIVPHYSGPHLELLLRGLHLPPRAQVLVAGCDTGSIIPGLLKQMETTDQGRIIALEERVALLNKARIRTADCDPRRVFLRSEPLQSLKFADNVFDVVISNLVWLDLADPGAALREFFRVLTPQGRLLLAFPTQGTFEEVFDFFAEVTLKHELPAVQRNLDALRRRCFPAVVEIHHALEAIGFRDVTHDTEDSKISFSSGKAFIEAPLVRGLFEPRWREAAGEQTDMLLACTQETIDTYYDGEPYTVQLVAAMTSGIKP
jgi:SAM-dependent methyltransferase